MSTDQAVARIRRYAAEQGLTRNQLAKLSGLHWHSLRDMDRDDWNPTLTTLRRLESIIPPEAEAAA